MHMNAKARVVCKTVLSLKRGQCVVVGKADNLENGIEGVGVQNKHWWGGGVKALKLLNRGGGGGLCSGLQRSLQGVLLVPVS